MGRTFLLTYTTVSGKTYTKFKTSENGPDYDTCISRIIDESDELAYSYIRKDVVYYINADRIESPDIEEVTGGQHIAYNSE